MLSESVSCGCDGGALFQAITTLHFITRYRRFYLARVSSWPLLVCAIRHPIVDVMSSSRLVSSSSLCAHLALSALMGAIVTATILSNHPLSPWLCNKQTEGATLATTTLFRPTACIPVAVQSSRSRLAPPTLRPMTSPHSVEVIRSTLRQSQHATSGPIRSPRLYQGSNGPAARRLAAWILVVQHHALASRGSQLARRNCSRASYGLFIE